MLCVVETILFLGAKKKSSWNFSSEVNNRAPLHWLPTSKRFLFQIFWFYFLIRKESETEKLRNNALKVYLKELTIWIKCLLKQAAEITIKIWWDYEMVVETFKITIFNVILDHLNFKRREDAQHIRRLSVITIFGNLNSNKIRQWQKMRKNIFQVLKCMTNFFIACLSSWKTN